jgi:hypothetical protein
VWWSDPHSSANFHKDVTDGEQQMYIFKCRACGITCRTYRTAWKRGITRARIASAST